jgi:hypothetical protein
MAEGFTKCKELSQFFLNGRKMKKNCEVFQIWNGHWSGAFQNLLFKMQEKTRLWKEIWLGFKSA